MIFLENNQDLISTKFYDASDGVWPGVAMLGLDFQKSRSSDFIWCAYDLSRFAAKKGLLCSPRGRLTASLC